MIARGALVLAFAPAESPGPFKHRRSRNPGHVVGRRGDAGRFQCRPGVAMNRQDYWLSSSGGIFARSLAGCEASSADPETDRMCRSLIESLDTLFGRDIEWVEMQTRVGGSVFSIGDMGKSTGPVAGVSEPERPSAAMLTLGLALAALRSEGGKGNRVNRSSEP